MQLIFLHHDHAQIAWHLYWKSIAKEKKKKSIANIRVGLFLDSLFRSINQYGYPYTNTKLSWLLELYSKSWNHVG